MLNPPPHYEQLKIFKEKRIPIPGDECFSGKNLCDAYPGFEASEEIYKIGTDVNSITTNQGIPVGGTVDGKDIVVNGTYRITVPVLFKNCNFKMGKGAKIIFETSSATYLRFYFCNFFSCDEMWEGIRVENSAAANQFIFSGCHIEDAFKALTIKEVGTVAIINTDFVNNYISITNLKQDGSVINGTIRGNTFMATAELRPLSPKFIAEIFANSLPDCGIYLVNTKAVIGSPGVVSYINLFTCINNGIYTINCDILSRNNHFDFLGQADFLGVGITSIYGSLRVKDKCRFSDISASAIYTDGADLTAENNDFFGDMFFGIECTNNDKGEVIDIHRNRMNLTGPNCFIGIAVARSQNGDGSIPSYTMINDNHLNISLPSANTYTFVGISAGAYVSVTTDEMQIFRDTILIGGVTPKAHGIALEPGIEGDNTRVEYNDIRYSNTTSAYNYGILVEGVNPVAGVNHRVSNNYITGRTGNFPGWCGIHTNSGCNVEYCNNTINDTRNGMHFTTGNTVELRGNNFNRHRNGIWISTDITDMFSDPAFIGVQTRRGNEWLGAIGDYVLYTAFCENCLNANQSRFFIETNTQPLFPWPSKIEPPISGSATDWFRFVNGDLDYCNPESAKMQQESGFEETVIAGTAALPASMEWDWKRLLQLKHYKYPAALLSENEQSYYANLAGSSAQAYAQITRRIIEACTMTSGQRATIGTYRAVISQKMQEWEDLTNAYATDDPENPSQDYLNAVEVLFPALTEAAQNKKEWVTARNAEMRNALLEIRQDNEALVVESAAGWMEARKLLQKANINYLLDEPMLEADYAALLNIASKDIESVGKAKTDVLRWLLPWDAAPYRNAVELLDTEEREVPSDRNTDQGLSVTPNPSDGVFTLTLPKGTTYASLQVLNASGISVLERVFNSDESLSLDLSRYPAGLYWVVLQDNIKGIRHALKVSVQH